LTLSSFSSLLHSSKRRDKPALDMIISALEGWPE
jgi:hypothetical protein